MIIFSSNGIASRNGIVQNVAVRANSETVSRADTERNFDRIMITSKDGDNAFLMGVKSRLSQEVRTTTTTGTLSALRQQYQSGQYQVDAAVVARKILMLGEE